MSVGENIRRYRKLRGVTQAQLAALIGCEKQYLHKILVGERSGEKYREAISVILEIDLVA